MTKGFRIAAAAIAASTVVWVGASASAASTGSPDLYVSVKGSDKNAGTGAAPLRTIQAALNKATAGTTVHLAAGTYRERVTTVRAGTAGKPISVVGPETGQSRLGRYQAVLTSPTAGRLLTIEHSYVSISGFTIDGQPGVATSSYPALGSQAVSFKKSMAGTSIDSKLVYVGYTAKNVSHVSISDMWLSGSGGECLRIRNASSTIEVQANTIQWCGMYAKNITGYPYHNGEGVYVGTSPKSADQPMHLNDTSNHVRIHDNVIRTFGSECFDSKENSHDNLFQHNSCQYSVEPLADSGSAVELRGARNTVTGNDLSDALGFGIKIAVDASKFDNTGNTVTGNRVSGSGGPAVTVNSPQKQGTICGNSFRKSDGASFAAFDAACKG